MLRNQIEAIVGELNAKPTFLYGTPNELNALVDDASFPCVFLFAAIPNTKRFRRTNSLDNEYSVYMEFLYKTDFGIYSAENEAVILQAKAMSDEFMLKLNDYRPDNQRRYFEIQQGDSAREIAVYNKYNVNSTGVNLQLNLKPMYSFPI